VSDEPDTRGLLLGKIVEDFFIALVEEGFLDGCVECNFPTPSVFVTEDDLLFCRRCRYGQGPGVVAK
jgi:hypothetical protein